MPNQRKLSEEDQVRLVDRYIQGAPIIDIVNEFGVSPSTVRNTVRRANKELRPVGRPKVEA